MKQLEFLHLGSQSQHGFDLSGSYLQASQVIKLIGRSSQTGKSHFQSKLSEHAIQVFFVTYAVCSMWNKRNRYHADSRQYRVSYDGSLPTKPRITEINDRSLVFLKVALKQMKV